MPDLGKCTVFIIWLFAGIVLSLIFCSKPKFLKVVMYVSAWVGSGLVLLCLQSFSLVTVIIATLCSILSIAMLEALVDSELVDEDLNEDEEDHYD